MFHVELRQFPHLARALNLTREQIETRFIGPWAAGESVEFDDRRWPSERARLTVYEGPELTPDQMGLGRAWGNVTRAGTDVTRQLLAEAEQRALLAPRGAISPKSAIQQLEQAILDHCAIGPLSVLNLIELVNQLHADWRVSDRIALAERSIWELLHLERITMSQIAAEGRELVGKEAWESVLLSWGTWASGPPTSGVLLELLRTRP
jgi:hypothetical protein